MAAPTFSTVGCISSNPSQSLFTQHSTSVFQPHLTGDRHLRSFPSTTRGDALRLSANPNGFLVRGSLNKEVIMVDPLEAKKLAAKQMQEIKAKERLQRRREIEAINGAWAMLGLTAGLVIEGHTGKSILDQLGGYWHSIVGFFVR